MPATQQSQAIALANQMLATAQTMVALRSTINELITQYNDQAAYVVWEALATCAQNADGSLGAADSTPNVAHPINTGVVTTLNRAVSANTLLGLVTVLEAYQAFLTNGTVATANRNAVLDPLIGG